MNNHQQLCFNTNTQKVCLTVFNTINSPLSTQVQSINNQSNTDNFERNLLKVGTEFNSNIPLNATNILERYIIPVGRESEYAALLIPRVV